MDAYQRDSAEAVLQVLMLTVYADRRRKPPEIDETRRRLLSLDGAVKRSIDGLAERLDGLIEKHDREIRGVLDDSDLLQVIETALLRIHDRELRFAVINAMCAVAWADGEYHYSENVLLERAVDLWGVTPPVACR